MSEVVVPLADDLDNRTSLITLLKSLTSLKYWRPQTNTEESRVLVFKGLFFANLVSVLNEASKKKYA